MYLQLLKASFKFIILVLHCRIKCRISTYSCRTLNLCEAEWDNLPACNFRTELLKIVSNFAGFGKTLVRVITSKRCLRSVVI